jgi:hypothetical protein
VIKSERGEKGFLEDKWTTLAKSLDKVGLKKKITDSTLCTREQIQLLEPIRQYAAMVVQVQSMIPGPTSRSDRDQSGDRVIKKISCIHF